MKTELQILKKIPSETTTRSSSSSLDDEHGHRYTSLKDIIVNPFSSNSSSYDQTYDLVDPSNIMIRNQLVKHAASVYLQSAAILVSRNQNCFVRFMDKVKIRASYVCDPFRAWFLPIYRSIEYLIGGALHGMIRNF